MLLLQSLLSALTGITLILFIMNAYLVMRNRDSLSLAFALICLGMLIYIPCNLLLYQVNTPARYLEIVNVQMFGTVFYHLGVVWFGTLYLGYPPRRFLIVYGSVMGIFLLLRSFNSSLMYSSFELMSPYSTLWGEQIWLPVSASSTFGLLYVLVIFTCYILIVFLCLQQIRGGNRSRGILLLASMIILLTAAINDMLIYSLNIRWLFLGEIGFTTLIVIMTLARADEIIRASMLAGEIQKLNAELEQRVQKRTHQLELANRELQAFSYSVSHDLRAPLRGIDGYSNLLLEDYGPQIDRTAQQFLENIRQLVKRMNDIIDNLLRLSIINRSELVQEIVYLSVLAEEIVAEFRQREPERQVLVHIQPDMVAEGDPKLLHIALENLLGNAWKFTQKKSQAEIHFSMVAHNGQNCYCVRDNGAGFDMQYSCKLFNAFQRLHDQNEFEGTGVGLAIVQRIIQKHNGRIFAEAEVDQGAAFYFVLS